MDLEEEVNNQRIENIIKLVESGKIVLFLGAGASKCSGVPIGWDLVELLRDKFNFEYDTIDGNIQFPTFNTACKEIILQEKGSKLDIYEYLKKIFLSCDPTEYHKILTYYKWPVIYTTNYDNILENAFRKNKESNFTPRVIRHKRDNIKNDLETVNIIKLNGCAERDLSEEGHMLLLPDEIEESYLDHPQLFKTLQSYISTCTIVYIGYSFDDLIANVVVRNLKRLMKEENIPRSYAIFRDLSKLKTGFVNSLIKDNIYPVQSSFEDFCKSLESGARNFVIKKRNKDDIIQTLRLGSRTVKLSYEQKRFLEFKGLVLHEEILTENKDQIEEFFKGNVESWNHYTEERDFIRFFYRTTSIPIYLTDHQIQIKSGKGGLLYKLISNINVLDPNENKIFLIKGIPGIGKTVLAHRIALDFYKKGYPVFYISYPSRDTIYKLFQNLQNLFSNVIKESKTLLIIDNAGTIINNLTSLILASRQQSIPIMVIAIERENVWQSIKKDIKQRILEQTIEEVSSLNFEFETEKEKEKFLDHLIKLNVLEKGEEIDFENIEEESFFGILYSYIEGAKEGLKERIYTYVRDLEPKSQLAIKVISFFHQFNLEINMEYLLRFTQMTHIDLDDFLTREGGLILDGETKDESVVYSLKHRIISETVFEKGFDTENEKIKFIIDLLEASNKQTVYENDLVVNVAVNNLTPKRNFLNLKLPHILNIFKAINKYNPNSVTLHHLGLVNLRMKHFRDADEVFQNSDKLIDTDYYESRKENRENLYTSWGLLYIRMAENETESEKNRDLYFNMAEQKLSKAKLINPSVEHTFNVFALLWKRKAEKETFIDNKLFYLGLAIKLLDIGIHSISWLDSEDLENEKTEILYLLNDFSLKQIEGASYRLAQKRKSSNGFYYLIHKKIEIMNQKKAKNINLLKKLEKEILSLIEKSYSVSKNHECIVLHIFILRKYLPFEYEKSGYDLLVQWYNKTREDNLNNEYLLDLAFFHFKKEEFDDYWKIHEILRNRTLKHKDSRKIIKTTQGRFNGEVFIKNNLLKARITQKGFFTDVNFNSFKQMKTFKSGDSLDFQIGFCYKELRVVDVKLK
ncbi:MAG: hypothetical protein HeimC3_48290 [Candidatus Heimdallarchaeota archaeon LC_3]|nr:MAG: hypothetical protein HeimC3_48290 [Candidatus Heimdallarchaeota archaeon LC_3]